MSFDRENKISVNRESVDAFLVFPTGFFREICLLAFSIVALGLVVSLELFIERVLPLITHIMFCTSLTDVFI